MSELINNQNKQNIRFDLLVTTSVIALVACVASIQEAVAADRPTVWIEGGWQFESITGSNDIVTPPLDGLTTNSYTSVPTAANFFGQRSGGFPSFTDMEKVLGRSGGAEGGISFQPKGSNWIFNVSARYGRAHSHRRLDQREEADARATYKSTYLGNRYLYTPHHTNYVIQATDSTEAHVILDFQAGRDIGVGLFGERTQSVLSLGARYAQMNMASKSHSNAQPDVQFYGHGGINSLGKYYYIIAHYHHQSATVIQRSSSFQGIGPSLSWNNTTGLLGNTDEGQLAVDWGANAAVLFGRQKSKVNYSTRSQVFHANFFDSQHKTINRTQSRRVTVPNLGGFAALSYRFTNAKLSMGYRADFFFGALDGGLDARRSMTTGYHGPYATISFGLGG